MVKPGDSGSYWCESRHRDSSNSLNITVTRKSRARPLPLPVGPPVFLWSVCRSEPELVLADLQNLCSDSVCPLGGAV